jgi:alkylated DNA repair dioxygenase AlkB
MNVDLGPSKMRTTSSRVARSSGASQGCLFAEPLSMPVGFAYRDELISQAQEQVLLREVETLPFKPFEFQGYLGKRRIVSFGWHYDFDAKTLGQSEPIPSFLHTLRDQAAAFANLPPSSLQQVLINEYAPGAGVGWHRDRPMFEDVIGVSLASACTLRLRQRTETGWKRASQILTPRSTISCADRRGGIGNIASHRLNSCATQSPSAILRRVPRNETAWSATRWIKTESPTDIIPIADGQYTVIWRQPIDACWFLQMTSQVLQPLVPHPPSTGKAAGPCAAHS